MPARPRHARWKLGSGRAPRFAQGALAAAALCGLACGDEAALGTRVCTEILGLRAPAAEVVETWAGARGVALDYRVGDEAGETFHRLECTLAETEPGRLRARAIRVDGLELSEAELVLVNSDLLLAEIRRADPGPPRSAGRIARWIARLRSRS